MGRSRGSKSRGSKSRGRKSRGSKSRGSKSRGSKSRGSESRYDQSHSLPIYPGHNLNYKMLYFWMEPTLFDLYYWIYSKISATIKLMSKMINIGHISFRVSAWTTLFISVLLQGFSIFSMKISEQLRYKKISPLCYPYNFWFAPNKIGGQIPKEKLFFKGAVRGRFSLFDCFW